MALPSKLKYLHLFNEGDIYLAQVESFTPAKLTRKLEAYRGGGMNGAAHVDLGLDDEALSVEWSIGGYELLALRQIGWTKISGVMLRFSGAIQREDSEEYDAVEIVVRGRHKELDRGEYKQGENSATKISTLCTYYKESVNGETIVEIDTVNFIENIDGKDRLAGARRAIGL